jgi:hypothetical protein
MLSGESHDFVTVDELLVEARAGLVRLTPPRLSLPSARGRSGWTSAPRSNATGTGAYPAPA